MAFTSKLSSARLAGVAVAGVAVAIGVAAYFAAKHTREAAHERLHAEGYLIDEVMRLCAPAQVLEFKMGSKSFFMKWDWVRGSGDIARHLWVKYHQTCPSSPIEWGGFRGIPLSVARERNLNLFVFDFSAVTEQTIFDKHEIPTNPTTRITDAPGGYVDDITEIWEWGLPDLSGTDHHPRYYRLQHSQGADGREVPAVLMSCSGNPPEPRGRMCSTRYRYEDLAIDYLFWPKGGKGQNDYMDRALNLPPGPAEPDGLLAADTRVRQWIDDLQHR